MSEPLSSLQSAQSNVLYSGSVAFNQAHWQPNTYWYYNTPTEGYANCVEIKTRDYDATVKFYRDEGHGRTLVSTVIVPLQLLQQFLPKSGSKR